jgi:hypothetical protein
VFQAVPREPQPKPKPAPPAQDISGAWEVEIAYEVGKAAHKLFLTVNGNHVTGSHEGWAFQGDLTGLVDGDRVELHSVLPAGSQHLSYTLRGHLSAQSMGGEADLGEYGRAKWHARRRQT